MLRSPPQPMWDLTIHPLSGPSILVDTCSLLQSMWDPPNPPPTESSVLAGTAPHVHPLRNSASSLAHRPVSGSNTITPFECPLWVFSFGLPLKVFKTHLLERGFHNLIKNVSFSSPTDVDLTITFLP